MEYSGQQSYGASRPIIGGRGISISLPCDQSVMFARGNVSNAGITLIGHATRAEETTQTPSWKVNSRSKRGRPARVVGRCEIMGGVSSNYIWRGPEDVGPGESMEVVSQNGFECTLDSRNFETVVRRFADNLRINV